MRSADLYTWVSTDEQADKGHSQRNQGGGIMNVLRIKWNSGASLEAHVSKYNAAVKNINITLNDATDVLTNLSYCRRKPMSRANEKSLVRYSMKNYLLSMGNVEPENQ